MFFFKTSQFFFGFFSRSLARSQLSVGYDFTLTSGFFSASLPCHVFYVSHVVQSSALPLCAVQ